MKKNKIIKAIGALFLHFIVLLLVLLTFSLLWAQKNYGNIGFEEILFHLNMPLKGTSEDIIIDYIKTAGIPTLVFFIIYLLVIFWPGKNIYQLQMKFGKRNWKMQIFPIRLGSVFAGAAAWTVVLVMLANQAFAFGDYVVNQFQQSKFIEEEYVNPAETKISFPEKKRNLIWICLESAESTAQNKENGGVFEENYISEMTEIAKNNVSFSQSELIEGAAVAPASGWTIAGLVAQTSGLPLKLIKYDDAVGGADNSMSEYDAFMPGATTLGDILEKEGYHNIFMAGSDFNFGGRTSYFTQHGSYEIWDYYTALEKGKIPEGYYKWWGFEDQKLYSYAKERILEAAEEDQPFNFSMLTVDTHHQDGFVCELCQNNYAGQYENVWACASRQLDEFLNWIKQQDFYENTTVVITGDHCSMDTDFYSDIVYNKHEGATERKVYNAFINSAVEPMKEKNRKFTTLDIFPSILAGLGARIDGDRLGLGTNLFSDRETLSEEYGYDIFFQELNKKSSFYNNQILYP